MKIRTSKGKALLTLVGAKEDDANQASPATGASPTPSKQRRRGSITEMFGGGGGGGGKSESQQADSAKSQRGSKTEKEVPLQGVGQFYRVHLSRAGGVNEEEGEFMVSEIFRPLLRASRGKNATNPEDKLLCRTRENTRI